MQKVASLSRSQLRLASVGGQHAISRHQQLTRLIRARLGEGGPLHLLTEPQVNANSGEIGWYTPLRGKVQPLSALPADEQARVRAVFEQQVAALKELAASLRAASPSGSSTDADIIEAALRLPDEATGLRVCDGQPILVGWGCEWGAADRSPVDLVGNAGLKPATHAADASPVGAEPMNSHSMQKVASLDRSQLRFASVSGQHAISRHQQLTRLIRARLGEGGPLHLLTEPQVNANSGEIGWYTPLRGKVQPLSALPADEQARVRAVFEQQVAALKELAASLRAASPSGSSTDADIIEAALRLPDEATGLRVCDGQPILVGWGCEWGAADRPPVDLVGYVKGRPAYAAEAISPANREATVAVVAPVVLRGRRQGFWGWLLWALNLLFLFFILLLFLRGCEGISVGWAGYFNGLFPAATEALPLLPPEPEEQSLRAEITALQLDIANRQGQCRAPEPMPVQKKGEDLKLLNQPGDKDVGFLKGCWQSITGLKDSSSGRPVDMEYCFDETGKGGVSVRYTGQKGVCEGGAMAALRGQDLIIETPNGAVCKPASVGGFNPWNIVCKPGAQGAAECQGQNHDGSRFGVSMKKN